LSALFSKLLRRGPRVAVVTPVGPGHAASYAECRASIERAWRTSRGSFSALEILPIDDQQGALGRSRARNLGIAKARAAGAEWIFFLDADDLMAEDAFAAVAAHLADHDAIWGLIATLESGESQPHLRMPQPLTLQSIDEVISFDPFRTLKMGHFVRAEIAHRTPFDENMDAGEDFDYYLRLWEFCRCIKVAELFFIIRAHRHSTGPRAASPEAWRAAVLAQLDAKRGERGLRLDSARMLETQHRCAAELQARYRARSLAQSEDCLGLTVSFPVLGPQTYVDLAGRSILLQSQNDDLVAFRLAWMGEYEPMSAQLWQTLARTASTIVDVGAYTGFYALLAARSAPEARIVAVEPLARNFARLEENVRLNGVTNVELVAAALSDVEREADIAIFTEAAFLTSGASLAPSEQRAVRSERVSCHTLDALLASRNVPPPGLVKIDVEGWELEVLRGMGGTLAGAHPDLLIEVLPDAPTAVLGALLETHGYRFYAISEPELEVSPLPSLRPGAGAGERNRLASVRPVSEVKALVIEALGTPTGFPD
jgi:FkbM family methyltransferase